MPITIYSFKLSPFCRSVLMTARQLNIDLNIIEIDPGAGQQFSPEYLKINLKQRIPTIDDDGFTLWESRAIMQYLCNQYAPDSSLYPKDPKKRAIVDRWLNFDLSLLSSMTKAITQKVFTGVEPTEDQVQTFKNNLKTMDQLIGNNRYLTGNDLTIADLALVVTTAALLLIQYDLTDYPNLNRWLQALSTDLPYFAEFNVFSPEVMNKWVAKSQQYLKRKLTEF